MITTFKDVIWKGKSIYDCKITRDMNNEQVVKVLVDAIEAIEHEIDLSQVKISELGIADKCKLQYKNMLTEILNALINNDKSFIKALGDIQQQVNNSTQSKVTDTDELVKTTKTDPTAGYLADKIVSPQTGSVTTNTNNQVSLMGFAPVGAVIMIDNGRVADFDATGKGKAGTDVWGWAISNGQNGTRNRLGKFPRFIGVLADAGNTGGANSTTVGKDNILSFDIAVSGAINEALPNDIKLTWQADSFNISNNLGSNTVWKSGDGYGGVKTVNVKAFNVKHSHTFTLKATHSNPNPVPFNIVPEYIYEIPIQRIL